ncbi:helix-turn-helix domain-containing protein [Mesorhizobium australicum]|uniref:PucR C-terminal helix-turn-helix domain-containing protein n=1 Tax=Mesorhizobium australicum TaxID=536018 RepID=A0A1X7P887_9HYPH|nr:GAF domain-containing protein [Mesorhizobium australicum]SMH47222.1 PucR C-terminal helix-turn-helix domain-containing protein [Mesorhizobium australicum]
MNDAVGVMPVDPQASGSAAAILYYRRLLDLLDGNAPLSSFEKLTADARNVAWGEELAEAIGDAIAITMRLRDNFELKRKREIELSALYATARDLSALRDTDQILQAIVQRARQLVGSDIAYLSAADEEHGDFFVRTTEGVVSQDFARIRVPRNIGVCGSVARTRRPFYSSNYSGDHNFDHDAGIDRAIRGEGIVSILGIPLELEAYVMGVLFVGDRYVRSYTPQEMAVLSSLGTFAALAIENARLLEEAQRALLLAKEANAALRTKADDIEQAAVAHEQLTELIARGGSLDDLVNRVSNLLKGQAGVVDESRNLISGAVADRLSDDALAKAVRESDRIGRAVSLPAADGSVTVVTAVMGGSARLGALVFTRNRPLSAPETRTLERSAIVTGIVLLSLDRIAQIAHRNVADTVSALLRGTTDPFSPESARRLPSGISLSWPVTVMLVELATITSAQASSALRSTLAGRDTIFAEFNGDLAIVTNAPEPGALANRISEKLEEAFGHRLSIVISDPIATLDKVPAEYESLRRCFGLMRGLNQHGRVVFEKTLSVYALLFHNKGENAVDLFLRSTIGSLIEHDERRKSQLAATLLAYLDAGRSAQKAAEMLGIHVNTMRQRLDTISLINPDWADPSKTLEVHIALRLHILGQAA